MPVTIKAANMKYRDSNGAYVGINSISDKTTAEQIAEIEAAGTQNVGAVNTAGTTQVAAVNAKGQEVLTSIPEDYYTLEDDVAEVRDIVIVSDTQPSSESNVLWIEDEAEQELAVPTYDEYESLLSAIDSKAPVVVATASGDIASFDDGADGMPVKSMTVHIDPVQEGTGNPSPTNVRPITGWTGANVYQKGKNLIGGIDVANRIKSVFGNNATINTDNQTVSFDPAASHGYPTLLRNSKTVGANFSFPCFYPFEENTQYTVIFKATSTTGNFNMGLSYTDGSTKPFITSDLNSDGYVIFTTAANKTVYSLYVGRYSGTTTLYYNTLGVFKGVAGIADYEPYSGTTVNIDWVDEAGTVYDGSFDATTGVLHSTRIGKVFTGNENFSVWQACDGGNWFSVVLTSSEYAQTVNYELNICSHFKPKNHNQCSTSDPVGYCAVAYNWIAFSAAFENANDFKAYLSEQYNAGTPVTVVYPPYDNVVPDRQLSQQSFTTFLGYNAIWADTGDVSVQYRADTKLFIAKNTPDVPVEDVQVNGTSVVTDGVANVPIASTSVHGAVKMVATDSSGLWLNASTGELWISAAPEAQIKAGENTNRPIGPLRQHIAVYYGLSKLAGEDLKNDTVTVGVYPEKSKSAISTMLNGSVAVSGTTPSITALPGVRYVCGEVATLDVTVPASGIIDVVFESGSTATVLTITGTVKWANGFDPTSLDANTTYEINIADGLGVAASWT